MMVRTGPGPNDWRDEGPASARSTQDPYAIKAVTVAGMVPILTHTSGNDPVSSAEVGRRKRRQAFSIHLENRK